MQPQRKSEAAAEAETTESGAEAVCRALWECGTEVVFGYAGGAILHFYDALHRDGRIHHVMVRHEQAAAHAAAGFARASGRPGVCVATSGPGATNLLTGIMDGHLDSTPMVVLAGQVPTRLIGFDAFQETDMMSMTGAITKHAFQPRSAAELEGTVRAAFEIASTGRPGPVYIDLPKDVLMAEVPAGGAATIELPGLSRPPAPPPAAIAQAAARIRAAERPMMLLGGGAVIAEAGAEITALVEEVGLPVVSTINAKGLVPEGHPQSHGVIGMYGRKSGVHGLNECDLVVAFGCRFTDRITGEVEAFRRGKEIIHIDVDAYELGKNVPAAVEIHADARSAARGLRQALRGYRPSEAQRRWAGMMGAAREVCVRCVPHRAPTGVHPKHVMDAIGAVRRPGDIVTTGVGQHQMFACHFLSHDEPRTFITSSGAGTMGYGLPAAIGALHARPGQRAFVIEGDGSFQMTAQELATAVQENLPLTIVILDNGQLGMVRQWQDREYDGRWEAVDFQGASGHPDFVRLAGAYGMPAESIDATDDLLPAVEAAAGRSGPTLLRIRVDPTVNNLPMMPAGRTFADFAGNCVAEPGVLFDPTERRALEEAAHGEL